MIYSGLSSQSKTRKAHGVAFCLDRIATAVWKNSGSEWEPVSDRILRIRLNCPPINITLIAVYSPVNPMTKEMADNSDKFYADLQETLDRVQRGDMLIIMGDLNARLGCQEHLNAPQCVGPFTADVQNENGMRLLDFCLVNDLVVTNTFFQHKTIHQTSWMHPGKKSWHMLDYTIVNRKFRTSVEDVRFLRRATGAIGTDHHLMRSKIRLHLRSRKKISQQKRLRLDKSKLADEGTVRHFQSEVKRNLAQCKKDGDSIDMRYAKFVTCIKETAQHHFQPARAAQNKRKEWMTDEILEVIEKKSLSFLTWQNHRGTPSEREARRKCVALRKLAKSTIDQRQTDYWDEISRDIESAIKQHDPATAYAMIRRLRGGKQRVENMPIRDKSGMLLLNSADRLDRWKEYFCELLNVDCVVDQTLINQIRPAYIPTQEVRRQEEVPTIEEVQRALNQMKNGKAPGNDQVTADLLKAGGPAVLTWLHELFVDIWQSEETVDDWTLAILIRLFKNKGDRSQCDNYRGISLLVVASKLFTRVIINRVQGLIDRQLLEAQAGFRANRSTIDQIFILKMAMEKSREYNRPIYMCFIDIQKAYDSVNRDLLWKICRQYGLTDKIVRLLKLMYRNSRARVRIEGDLSDSFDIETGVMQGGIPSPVLFNILFDFIIRKVLEEANITGLRFSHGSNDFFHGPREKGVGFDVLTLMYADDLTAMCNTLYDLEKFIKSFEKVTQQYGLTMSVKKTCVMSLQQYEIDKSGRILRNQEVDQPDIDFEIRNQRIQTTDSFTSLGCVVSRDHRSDREMQCRLSKATSAFNMLRGLIWYRKVISIDAKLRIFRACVMPVLLYGSEAWTLTVMQEKRLNSFYMRCLRTILGLNISDRVSNQRILQLSGQPPLENIMRRNRLRWFGHVNRMDNDKGEPSLVKKIMFSYFPNDKRPSNVGIRKRWEAKLMEDLVIFDIRNWRRDTLDRDKWRELINKHVWSRPTDRNMKEIIHRYKANSERRRTEEMAEARGAGPRKVTEVLAKNTVGSYTCPKCRKLFKPQGITGHVKSCATNWCKRNNIQGCNKV